MQNKKQYAENWNDEIRPSILKRDNYKCCYCGMPHRQWIAKDKIGTVIKISADEVGEFIEEGWKAYRIYLQVAHLDHNKSNNSPGNLLSLCQPCHHRNDQRHKILMRIANLVR